MPEKDVIIIGGGLAGAATAFYLAQDGVSVTLIERGGLGGEASGANAGSLHAQIPADPFRHLGEAWARQFQPALTLYVESLRMWGSLEAELATDLEIKFGGGLMVATSESEMAELARKAEIERAAGLEIQLLNREETRRRAPYLSDRAIGGAFCPQEGKANPLLVAPAYARAAARLGAEILSSQGNATITREATHYEVTANGQTHRARRIVIAGGTGTPALLEMLGLQFAIQAFPIQVSVTEPATPFIPHLVYCAGEKLTMKQTRIGSVLIGGGWNARIDPRGRPIVDSDSLASNLALACAVVPGVASLTLLRTWAAFVNGTADWLPILGPLPGAPGAYINYVPWLGFSGGPAAARALADMVQGRTPSVAADFADFAPK